MEGLGLAFKVPTIDTTERRFTKVEDFVIGEVGTNVNNVFVIYGVNLTGLNQQVGADISAKMFKLLQPMSMFYKKLTHLNPGYVLELQHTQTNYNMKFIQNKIKNLKHHGQRYQGAEFGGLGSNFHESSNVGGFQLNTNLGSLFQGEPLAGGLTAPGFEQIWTKIGEIDNAI